MEKVRCEDERTTYQGVNDQLVGILVQHLISAVCPLLLNSSSPLSWVRAPYRVCRCECSV